MTKESWRMKKPETIPCRHNPRVDCDEWGNAARCRACGWSPAGEAARKKVIRERDKNGTLRKDVQNGKIC